MAGLRLHLDSGLVTLAAANTEKQLMFIAAPTNQKLKIEKIVVSGDAVATNDPLCILNIATGTGTVGGGAAITPVKLDQSNGETPQVSAYSGSSGITGITTALSFEKDFIGTNGSKQIVFPPGREIYLKGGDQMVIAITTGSAIAATTHARVQVYCEE